MAWLGTVSAAPPASPIPAASAATTNVFGTSVAVSNAPGVVSTVGAVLVVDDKHPLAPGDRLSFQITEDREPPKPLIVTDSGEVDIPYIGRVSVAGKTCKEVAILVKTQLEKEYYYRATVAVGLDQVNRIAGKVYVWGQVRTQGAVEIPANESFTAGKAILRAGGFADFANKKKVKLVRSGKPGSTDKQTFELNMVEILEEGKTEKDILLQQDDFIIVPARLVNW
jgi:protein involved in polysaccharide export with SLBB domain